MSCQSHPDHPDLVCDNTMRNHKRCTFFDPEIDDYREHDNPDYVVPKKTTKQAARGRMSEMATSVAPAPRVDASEGFQAGLEGSERAASRWDDDQKALVDKAIVTVATRHAGGGEFTTDAIWDELNGAVPVTKGLTARLSMAVRRGVIDNTGKTVISQRGGHHDHGQRLAVWYSLIEQ